jgi:hypothetical protein
MEKIKDVEYDFFNKGMLRVPCFPVDYLNYIDDINFLLSIDYFGEAIYIASPSLYEDIYIKNKRTEKVILPFIRYFIRACTRCTPYGLFAGCEIISVEREQKNLSFIEIERENEYQTYSRIDMEYLCDFIRILEQNYDIRNQITYHVNTTLYHIHKSLRYIEYSIKNGKRKYSFSEVKLSDYLELIIKKALLHSCTIKELASEIVSDDVNLIEAIEFINELIESQILISTLEPSVSGNDLIIQIKDKLDNAGYNNESIDKILSLLCLSDKMQIGTRYNIYREIDSTLSNLFPSPKKNLLHIDCLIPLKKASIGNQICNTVLDGLSVLSRLISARENELVVSFRKTFYSRYEEQEIPLVIALDPQVGVGFGDWKENQGDVNPLVDDLAISNVINQNSTIVLDSFSQLLISKYEKCIKNNSNSINITNDDLKLFTDTSLGYLPNQLYTIIKVIDINEDNTTATIFLNGFTGPSSANLFSRFCYLNKKVHDFTKEITDAENSFFQDKIVAEISHLPEDRMGNIQMHPHNRKYEISYLSNPCNSDSEIICIPIDDIMISVPHGQKIILRSKKYNKEVVPRLTTAHNYTNGLPVYYFLCSIQHQNMQSLSFDWGPFFNTKPLLPRVTYNNIILFSAQWKLSSLDLPKQDNIPFDDYYTHFLEWKNSKGMPDLVEIVEYDNTLLIDFTKKTMVKLFLDYITKKKSCILKEFLFANNKRPFVTRNNNYFTNEFVLCLQKSVK